MKRSSSSCPRPLPRSFPLSLLFPPVRFARPSQGLSEGLLKHTRKNNPQDQVCRNIKEQIRKRRNRRRKKKKEKKNRGVPERLVTSQATRPPIDRPRFVTTTSGPWTFSGRGASIRPSPRSRPQIRQPACPSLLRSEHDCEDVLGARQQQEVVGLVTRRTHPCNAGGGLPSRLSGAASLEAQDQWHSENRLVGHQGPLACQCDDGDFVILTPM